MDHPLSVAAGDAPRGGSEEATHTADLALKVWGENLGALMVHAALGMNALMGKAGEEGGSAESRALCFTAADPEELLVSWLSELAYLAESQGVRFYRFAVESVSDTQMRIYVSGGRTGGIKRTIKAVTYHNLAVVPSPRGVETTVVFDV